MAMITIIILSMPVIAAISDSVLLRFARHVMLLVNFINGQVASLLDCIAKSREKHSVLSGMSGFRLRNFHFERIGEHR